ncbi:SDR family oxidoreductase [Pararhodonellum marinum]|uniref:SDR family oxidoreductase n=1 Tax=Pararhodonellum marinum TaxID=2755358 RepID=UPI0018900799|nr:SDR family oxidoreductase [Pararhodonellum marinum]
MPIQKSDKPTLLITGANGLLGQNLLLQLLEDSPYRIIATGRGGSRLPDAWNHFTYREMDLVDHKAIRRVFGEEKPDIVIHAAAMTHVDQCELNQEECYQQNVVAVQNLIKACELESSFLIHLSTDFIFDGESGPYLEEASPNPVNYYGETKWEAERLVQNAKLDWAIVRTVLVYGALMNGEKGNFITWIKSSLEAGKTLTMVNDHVRTPTFAGDLAAGCLLIAKNKAKGIYNISGEETMTPYDMAIATARYFKLPEENIKKVDSTTFTQDAKRPMITGFDIEKAKKMLGYSPKSFKEGIGILAKQIKLARS